MSTLVETDGAGRTRYTDTTGRVTVVDRSSMTPQVFLPNGKVNVGEAAAAKMERQIAGGPTPEEEAERKRQALQEAEEAARQERKRQHAPWLEAWPALRAELQQDGADARQRLDESLAAEDPAAALTAALDVATATVVLSRATIRTSRAREAVTHNRAHFSGGHAAKPELPAEFTRMVEALIAERASKRLDTLTDRPAAGVKDAP